MKTYMPNSHCSFCGTAFPILDDSFPKRCSHCQNTTYANPTPVVVVIVPVEKQGILLIRRATSEGYGKLALPGGYMDLGESWQEGAARELREETGINISHDLVSFFHLDSSEDGHHVLIFCTVPSILLSQIPEQPIDQEVSEYLVTNTPLELAFSTHTEVLARALKQLVK